MKKIFLTLCVCMSIAVLLTACHKDSGSGSTYYIKCKIDSTDHTFSVNTIAHTMSYGSGLSGTSLVLAAGSGQSNAESLNLGISFSSNAPAAGTYSKDDTTANYDVGGVYNPGSLTTAYSAGTTYQSALPLSITITNIDSKEIIGTFKGAFYKSDNSRTATSSEYKTITNGEFKLPVK